jgi:hypothetical protein
MIDWDWIRKDYEPADVLDAARDLEPTSSRVFADPTACWVKASTYLEWASAAITRGGDDAWDCAAGWSKRAVCCRMDAILVNNHFGSYLGHNYKKKAGYLSVLDVPGLSVLRDLVIDPRNDIEHSYTVASEAQAKRAFDIGQLFLGATEKMAAQMTIVAHGWNVNYRGGICDKRGHEFERHEFSLRRDQKPMLLIDSYSSSGDVFVLNPKDELLAICPLKRFAVAELISLNEHLRKCLAFDSYSSRQLAPKLMSTLRDQLRLGCNRTSESSVIRTG